MPLSFDTVFVKFDQVLKFIASQFRFRKQFRHHVSVFSHVLVYSETLTGAICHRRSNPEKPSPLCFRGNITTRKRPVGSLRQKIVIKVTKIAHFVGIPDGHQLQMETQVLIKFVFVVECRVSKKFRLLLFDSCLL
jgi:hypothetical protein